ncbi:MAG: hypothetical protein M3Z03_07695, partial [Actinomycetota bacterium]|nr:hypothetical protein [Actinomycetota bacterium]
LNIYEPDGPDFVELQLILTGGQAGDVLGVTVPGGFTFVDDSGGQWRVIGTGTVADYEAILRSVTLANPGGLEPGTRNVQFSVTNADGNAAFTDRDVVVTGV